ncbi:hypothetical protein D3C77_745310 [compost metagenome]
MMQGRVTALAVIVIIKDRGGPVPGPIKQLRADRVKQANDPTNFSGTRPRSTGAGLFGRVKTERIQRRYRH